MVWAGQPALAETTVNFGGRLQIDAALYDEDVTELDSGTEFRRARFYASGQLDSSWDYKAQIDFADGDLEMKDAFLRYSSGLGKISLGQFKMPFGLEELTSSKYITFMERALPNVFVPSRRIGAGLNGGTEKLYYGAAVFGQAAGDHSGDEGLGLAGRLVLTPVREESRLIHFGAAAVYEEAETTDAGTSSVRIRARPESHVTSARLIDTGTLESLRSQTRYGLEFAGLWGPFSIQAEYMTASVQTSGAAGDVDFDGYYAYASWFPSGQRRAYKDGVFDRVQATGAWELALRFSGLNLEDGPVAGGSQDDITLGVNYYVNPYLRFMLNYVYADVDNGINGDESPSVLQFRASMDFK